MILKIKRLHENVAKYNKELLVLLMFIIVYSFSVISIPIIFEVIIDSYEKISDRNFWIVSIVLLCLLVLSIFSKYIYTKKSKDLKHYIMYEEQVKLLKHGVLKRDLSKINKTNKSEWFTCVLTDTDNVSNYLSTYVELVFGFSQFVFAVIYGFLKAPILVLCILGLSFFSMILPKLFSNLMTSKNESIQKSDEDIKNFAIEIVQKKDTLKTMNMREFIKKIYTRVHMNYQKNSIEHAQVKFKMISLSLGTGFIMNNSWIIIGLVLVLKGNISIGVLFAFLILSNCYNWPFFELSNIISNISLQEVSLSRISSFILNGIGTKEVSIMNIENGSSDVVLSAEGVSFRYDDDQPYIIRNFSFDITTGEKIVITGENGSGKSTLLKLLSGMYDVSSGSILFSGKSNTIDEYYQQISYIGQEDFIIEDTIMNNLRYGDMDATDEEIYYISKKFNCHYFISKTINGYQSIIGKDVDLSLGEKQRIAIARSFIKKPKILFLDESTSALDEENEKLVIDLIMTDKQLTVIMVAHKKDIIKRFDREINIVKDN